MGVVLSERLEQRIVDYLSRTAAARSTAQIASAVKERNRARVAQALLELQAERKVKKTASGWVGVGLMGTGSGRPGDGGAQFNGDNDAKEVGGARGMRLIGIDPGSRWADFRRLCAYYADCVRLEERASVKSYADREGEEFVQLPSPINFRAVCSGVPVRLSAPSQLEGFLRTARSGRRLGIVYLGAPVDVFPGTQKGTDEPYRLVSPIFVIQVVVELREGMLELRGNGVIELNHGWLDKRLPNAVRKREFLEKINLTSTAMSDSDQDDLLAVEDFEGAFRALFACYRSWWQETPDLARFSAAPPLSEIDTRGVYNRVVLMTQPTLKFTRRLHKELRDLATTARDEELDRSALRLLFPHTPPNDEPEPVSAQSDVAEFCLLNERQREACRLGLDAPLSVVTGPPGTGKSTVVSHVLANMAMHDRPALFASRNHQAIEAVEPKLNQLVEPEALVVRPTRAFHAQQAQFEWHQAMTLLLSKPPRRNVIEDLEMARARLRQILDQRHHAERGLSTLFELEDLLVDAESELRQHLRELPPGVESRLRPDVRLPSVEELRAFERSLARRKRLPAWIPGWIARWLDRPMASRYAALERRMAEPLGDSMRADPRSSQGMSEWMAAAVQRWTHAVKAHACAIRLHNARARLERLPDRAALNVALEDAKGQLEAQTAVTLSARAASSGARLSEEQRERFAQLRAAFINRRPEMSEDRLGREFRRLFHNSIQDLMSHFPLWAVSNLSVSRALPFAPASFDLVVIDEASQCDIASVVPLLYRARRAMVVGDPMQLSHITGLNADTEMNIRRQHGVESLDFERFTFRANSFYQLAGSARGQQPIMLENHYRCHPTIADYCNDAFYNGNLCVMTDAGMGERLGLPDSIRGVRWTDARGDITPASSGCYSTAHIDRVLQELRELEQQDFGGTVGVVTPFAAHRNRLQDRVHGAFRKELLDRWRFLVHTADGFQGDERDLLLFSLVGGPDMPRGSAYFIASNQNRFNVAASRAKAFLHVIGDSAWAAECGIPFVQRLHAVCTAPEVSDPRPRRDDLIGPVWEPYLARVMRERGLDFEQQYHTQGYYLDFAIFRDGIKLNVEVDGEAYHRGPGGKRRTEDLYRDLILQAAGWRIERFWVYELKEDIDGCFARIEHALGADAERRSPTPATR